MVEVRSLILDLYSFLTFVLNATSFALSTTFVHSINFDSCIYFYSVQNIYLNSSWNFCFDTHAFVAVCWSSNTWRFSTIFLLLISCLTPLRSKNRLYVIFYYFKFVRGFFCRPAYGLSYWTFYVNLRRMCILMLLQHSININLGKDDVYWYWGHLYCHCFFLSQLDLSITKCGMF